MQEIWGGKVGIQFLPKPITCHPSLTLQHSLWEGVWVMASPGWEGNVGGGSDLYTLANRRGTNPESPLRKGQLSPGTSEWAQLCLLWLSSLTLVTSLSVKCVQKALPSDQPSLFFHDRFSIGKMDWWLLKIECLGTCHYSNMHLFFLDFNTTFQFLKVNFQHHLRLWLGQSNWKSVPVNLSLHRASSSFSSKLFTDKVKVCWETRGPHRS